MELNVFVDGGARGNPGEGAVGVVITLKAQPRPLRTQPLARSWGEAGQGSRLKGEEQKVIHKFGKRIGVVTNNEAEYQAVIEALRWLKASTKIHDRYKLLNIYLDSKLVCNQLRGLYKVKNAKLRELLLKVRMLEQEAGGKIYYHLIPRERNREADKLVNQALNTS